MAELSGAQAAFDVIDLGTRKWDALDSPSEREIARQERMKRDD